MSALPNPFDAFAAVVMPVADAVASVSPPAAESAAVSLLPAQGDAAADQFPCLDDCIEEIFIGALALDRQFILDEERFMLDIEELPLFLQRAAG